MTRRPLGLLQSCGRAPERKCTTHDQTNFCRPFYVRYNSLAASDIGVFTASYNEAHARLTKFIGELERSKEKGSDVRNEIARLRARRDQLQSELKSQEAHVKAVRERLQTESAKWFDRAGERQGLLVSQLLEVCFYPRAVQSPADALFVAKFIRLAHSLGTPNFPTVLIYNGVSVSWRRVGRR